jgi:hypothetical protein
VAGFVISEIESSISTATEFQAVASMFEAHMQLFLFGIVVLLLLTRSEMI